MRIVRSLEGACFTLRHTEHVSKDLRTLEDEAMDSEESVLDLLTAASVEQLQVWA
jgi:hypothetical protein